MPDFCLFSFRFTQCATGFSAVVVVFHSRWGDEGRAEDNMKKKGEENRKKNDECVKRKVK